MKNLLRSFFFNSFVLWFCGELIPALSISGSWQTVLFSGMILTVLMYFIKPLLKVLLIPINILTFGLFSWFINVIVIYLLTVIIPDVQISAWVFHGFSYAGFVIPKFEFSYFVSLVLVTFAITFFANLLNELT